MIIDVEKQVYDFLVKIMEGKGFNIYRGFLPTNDFKDRESGKKTNDYFPFVILRVIKGNQNIVSNLCNIDFELWIGTKEDKEEDYLKNLSIGEYVREKLLDKTYEENSFTVNLNEDYGVEFVSDTANPYFYSKVYFTVYGEPIEQNILNIEEYL